MNMTHTGFKHCAISDLYSTLTLKLTHHVWMRLVRYPLAFCQHRLLYGVPSRFQVDKVGFQLAAEGAEFSQAFIRDRGGFFLPVRTAKALRAVHDPGCHDPPKLESERG